MPSPLMQERARLRRVAARLTAQRGHCRVPALILMTDDDRHVDWIEAVEALPREAAVVVRSRCAKRREALALQILAVAKPRRIRVCIASDLKLAIRLRATGVHMPEKQMQYAAQLRRQLPLALLTASAHGPRGLWRAAANGADAVLLSPVFTTASHSGARPLGVAKWAAMRSGTCIPVLALGGVSGRNADSAISAGATGLAVIGSWTHDPQKLSVVSK